MSPRLTRSRRAPRNAWTLFLGILAGLLPTVTARGGGPPDVEADEVLRATLSNGLRVVAVRTHLAPVVTTILSYLVGANDSPQGFPGMAHAQEHLMFRGSPGLSGPQLARIGATLGGNFNADAKQTVTQYFFTVPAENLALVLRLEAIRMRSVLNTQNLWEKERDALKQEVAQYLSDPEYLSSKAVLASLFEGSAYGQDPLGTTASFDKTSAAMLRAFHRTWYTPNNAVMVIVGDIDPAQALREVRSHFANIPPRKIPRKPKTELGPVKPALFALDTAQPHGSVTISFRLPGSNSPDFAAATVLAAALASKSGGLYALVAQGKALSTDFSFDPLPVASIGVARAAFPKDGDSVALTDEVKEVLSRLVRDGVGVEMVEAAKRHELRKAELEKSSVWNLAVAWSRAVAIEGRSSPDDDVRAIREVTAADVDRVAREYLDPARAVTAILTPRSAAKPVPPEPSRRPASPPPAKQTSAVALPRWAAKSLQRVSIAPSALDPSVSTFANGLELIVQPRSSGRALIVSGRVKTEPSLAVPKGKEGVQDVLGQLFSFGTASLDRLAFQRALDDIGAEESAGVEFSLRVLAEHFDRGVELLADNLLRPALPEQSFLTVQRQRSAAVAGHLESPSYAAARALRLALLPAGDPRLRETTPATVEALTHADVRDYHRRTFRPDLTKIVVVGNVAPEHAREVFTKHFAQWTADGPKPEVLLPPVPPSQPSSATIPDASRVQSQVTLAQTLDLRRSDPDYYALELGNRVLVGAFSATRLFRDLREESGLVYTVSSTFDVQKTRAFYAVRYACDPANVSRARQIVVRDLEQMRTAPVSPAELEQARALALRQISLAEASAEEIARGLLYRATEELPLDEPTLAARRYATLTAEEVRAVWRKWIRPNDLVAVTQGPPPE